MQVTIEVDARNHTGEDLKKAGVEKKVRLVMENMEHVYFDYWDEELNKVVQLRLRVKSVTVAP